MAGVFGTAGGRVIPDGSLWTGYVRILPNLLDIDDFSKKAASFGGLFHFGNPRAATRACRYWTLGI
jgi:hypothetical protein